MVQWQLDEIPGRGNQRKEEEEEGGGGGGGVRDDATEAIV